MCISFVGLATTFLALVKLDIVWKYVKDMRVLEDL
jgi:hypothetical protein